MYCNQCGKELPENSKFCNECGTPVVEKKEPAISNTSSETINIFSMSNRIEQNENNIEIESYLEHNNIKSDKEDIPTPKLSKAFWICGVILFFCFLYLKSAIGNWENIFILDTIVIFITFIVCALVCFGTMYVFISDYRLSKKDFEKYKAEVEENKKFEKHIEEVHKKREEEDKRKQEELNSKRAEYRAKGIPTCPKCGSPSIATINRGYSMVSGFIGSGKPVNVCQICGYKWQIGK